MIMENDKLIIPEKYTKMSLAEIEREERRMLEEIKSKQSIIRQKKNEPKSGINIRFSDR